MNHDITPASTVGSIAATIPGAARVFEQFGLDYCCAGRIPLSRACAAKGLAVADVIQKLSLASDSSQEEDWSRATMTQLADHIEASHHQFLKTELPRLAQIIDKVVKAHGERHPELSEVRDVFQTLAGEMSSHMAKEEQVLFPILRNLEDRANDRPVTVDGPINCLMHEHDAAGELLQQIRSLTNGFTPPKDACTTFRVLLKDLQNLEQDLHQHVHEENNILFPKAMMVSAGQA